MTAINIRATAESATVWADGLLYDTDGTVLGLTHKARRIGDWNAVLLTSGLVFAGDCLAEILPSEVSSYEAFLNDPEGPLDRCMAHIRPVIADSDHRHFVAFIAGWSPAHGGGQIVTYKALAGAVAEVGTRREVLLPLLRDSEQAAVAARLKSIVIATGRRPTMRELAVTVMETQRVRKANPEFVRNTECSYVGGHVTETTIDASGIRASVVHRWNDRIGEPVQVEAAFPENVAPMLGETRALRRAEEKRARKAAKLNRRSA